MRLVTSLCCFFALSFSGCASSPSNTQQLSSAPHAECLVCKTNADLACVDVAVDKDTPHYAYNGKTYYFCSEECKARFAKNPPKYLSK